MNTATSMPVYNNPLQAGIGLRYQNSQDILNTKPKVGFLEAHSENYFSAGGPLLRQMEELATHYPLSLHGVGLSLGSATPLDKDHLKKLKALVNRFDPFLFSEHVSWSGISQPHRIQVPDLLPMPYTKESLANIVDHIDQVQTFIGRKMLVENPSSYMAYKNITFTEPEFLNEICRQTGCSLLLDINNIYVSAHNLGFDALTYLQTINATFVEQIHLAGYTPQQVETETVLIDTHSKPVYDPVWKLYEKALKHLGDTPTLIEWDLDIPKLDILVAEAHKADAIRAKIFGEHNEST